MKLIPISEHPDAARILYELLAERTREQSISHKRMPTWEEHLAFVARYVENEGRNPREDWTQPQYEDWCLIDCEGECAGPNRYGDIVGCVYLTRANEIGVSILRDYQRLGIGPHAVKLLMEKHGKRRYLANINPANESSRKMFEKLGFKLIQVTYALEAE